MKITMQRVLSTLTILSLAALASCICVPRGHSGAQKCPYLAKQGPNQCGPQECGPQQNCGPQQGPGPRQMGMPNAGPMGCEPMAMELMGRVDRLEQRLNELMRRFDEHQGEMRNRDQGPAMGNRRQARMPNRDAMPVPEMPMQQNMERRVIEIRSDESGDDARKMLEDLRGQLEQMKAQMLKMRKAQIEPKPEKG